MPTVVSKTALVFGADATVGRECVSRLRQQQVRVCSADHGDLEGKDLEVGWNGIVDQCITELGDLDAFVCCAPDVLASSLLDTTLETFRRTLNSTALSGWLGQKQAIAAMRRQGRGGRIVHVTSVLARFAAANASASCASEAGILMSSKAAALECAKNNDNITVNTVLVGPRSEQQDLTQLLPGAMVVSPEAAADAVVYFLSPDAAYLTGTEMAVDGGFLCQ